MPSAPTQKQIDQAKPYLDSAGVPGSLTQAVWQALDAAGYTVVTKSAGAPAVAIDATVSERVSIAGLVGVFLVGVKVGERGWMVCVETMDSAGALARSEWVFSSGAGDLLKRAKTTGRWTVGTSVLLAVGSDSIT